MSSTGKRIRTTLLVVALGAAVGCTAIYRTHGYIPPQEILSQVTPGEDTRASVEDIAGPPTTGSALGDGNFYYVQSRFRHFAFTEPSEVEREVLAVSFDSRGVVRNIERFGLEEGRVVRLSRRVTDDGIQDTSFLGQLLGAIGNFDAGSLLEAPGG
ncbi:outer membrane protein assembly factor BamE [Salibaculum sp.]|uniref:outer membrane protein assembly factor BamE n=1 Tax=Salibaculum sp. TaxID=2855480 RepID=UPI002B46B50A|nr:outer membrane protein assembly factor BamE [Salibaculum sp.]HKL70470.1 outer membrane protein assembly factor BamE [Salibaculum sp.]